MIQTFSQNRNAITGKFTRGYFLEIRHAFFNTEGPVKEDRHYCLSPLQRWNLEEILALIDQEKYFLLHAPRQTGKTTCLLALADYLNRQGRYRVVYANIETAQAARENVALAMTGIVQTIAAEAAWQVQDAQVESLARRILAEQAATVVLGQFGAVVRDLPLAGGVDAGRSRRLDRRYADFPAPAITRGLSQAAHPVSADGHSLRGAGFARPKENLILRRVTHLDQLTDKLREARVRRVIEPMLAGMAMGEVPEDDRQYLVDLGLLRREDSGGLVVANPIYREVLPRALARGPQDSLPRIAPTWLNPDGSLNPEQLLTVFLGFWRQHGQPLLGSAPTTRLPPIWC